MSEGGYIGMIARIQSFTYRIYFDLQSSADAYFMIVVWLWKGACQDPCVMKYTKYGWIEVSQFIQCLSSNTASTNHTADDNNTFLRKIGWWHYNPNDPITKQSKTFVDQCNCYGGLHPTALVISSSHEALHTKRFIPQPFYFCLMHMKRQIYSIHNVWSWCLNFCRGMYLLYNIIISLKLNGYIWLFILC